MNGEVVRMRYPGHLLDVSGLRLGHMHDEAGRTGCTAVVCPNGAVAAVDVRGAAPGTRETDVLRSGNLVRQVHAVLLAGGSAFGLGAAGGVMRALEEAGIGFDAGVARVPIVPAAALFDLGVGRPDARPDEAMGYAAALAALQGGLDVRQGCVGAGCGASVGKLCPGAAAARGGVGSASLQLPGGATVAALVAVNAAGDVVDPWQGDTIACGEKDGRPVSAMEAALHIGSGVFPGTNTCIGVVATNARLTRGEAGRVCVAAHDGLALAVRPCHTIADGDTLFALSTDELPCSPLALCAAATVVVARACVNAALAAREGA